MKTKILLKVLFLSSFMFLKSGFVFADEVYEDVCLEENNTNTNQGKTYKVGDKGPAGGYIFYDKGSYSNGWRYLEAAPKTTEKKLRWTRWTKDEELKREFFIYSYSETKKEIGAGAENTKKIVKELGWSDDYAAGYCASLTKDNQGNKLITNARDEYYYKDNNNNTIYPNAEDIIIYFLPSLLELELMYKNLHFIGGYWSSSEKDASNAWYMDPSDGYQGCCAKNIYEEYVRCARAF